ncbi:MAG: hypothetical protein R3C56_09350 [Pirellulaceae bacterium]
MMNDDNLNDIDGGLVNLFEQDWLKGEPKNLAAYLPPPETIHVFWERSKNSSTLIWNFAGKTIEFIHRR